MAKEKEEKPAAAVETPQEPVTNPNEVAWFAGMEEKYPDLKGDREALFKASKEGYDSEHEYAKKSRAESEELNAILESDPDLNATFTEIFSRGKDGHPFLAVLRHAKPLVKKYLNGEIDDEEFIAEMKREEESNAALKRKQEMQEAAFAKECEARGWDVADTLTKLDEILNSPCETEEQCREQVNNMFKIIEFDDAVSAAEVRGKNATINEEKRKPQGGQMGNNGAPAPANTGRQSLMAQAAEREAKMKKTF